MTTPDLHTLAHAISDKSPAIKTFALAVADVVQPVSPPTVAQTTGGHYVDIASFPKVAAQGWKFAYNTVQPGDLSSIDAYAAAAKSTGLKLMLGLYPYPYSNQGGVTISAAGKQSIQRLASHPEAFALFVFNEPYGLGWATAQLRTLYIQVKSLAPNLKVWHDIGQPSLYAPTVGDQSGICDIMGIWRYPFTLTGGYQKAASLQTLATEQAFCKKLGVTPAWLVQTLAEPVAADAPQGFAMPTAAQLSDYVQAVRQALDPAAFVSMYVWDRISNYTDSLSAHPELLAATT